ncbi:unnamed protein product [Diamesa hyperborea]
MSGCKKNCDGFIVPQEVPSLLSLVYSNIPPIKKGTDSRVGFGYRLGDHADFQVQFELGPQKETKAIGTGSSNSKRNIRPADEWQIEKQLKKEKAKNEASSWLEKWSQQIKSPQKEEVQADSIRSPVMSESVLQHLQKLYGNVDEKEAIAYQDIKEQGVLPAVQQTSHLPMEALKILQSNRAQQQQKSVAQQKKKDIKQITADLSNVEFE